MRAVTHGLALGLMLLPAGAPAAELMLEDDSPPSYTAVGWSALGLALLSAAYAADQYAESQDQLDAADEDHDVYKETSDPGTATLYRDRTERHHDRAVSAEARANIAILATVLLGATAYYSFTADPEADRGLWLLSHDTVTYRLRF